jgi:GTP-binding protein YchF
MKLGIIGLARAGKTTVFEALTGNLAEGAHKGESRIGTIRVPDERIDILSRLYTPRKTIYATVAYFLPGFQGGTREGGAREQQPWQQTRDCDALIHVVRNFSGYGFEVPRPAADLAALDQELILADLVVVEKRLERLELDQKRGKKPDLEELALLTACRDGLEKELPLRAAPALAAAPQLRGFAFLSAKPMLVLFNNEDDDDTFPATVGPVQRENGMVMRAKLEHELVQMSAEEAAEFLAEFAIAESAMDRVIKKSYDLLGLISFFTVGEDEVRAWTVRRGTAALDAADVIHSDIKKGFIRAEVLAYRDLMAAGSYAAARKQGTVRLEGKTYAMQDGDIVNFRFNL